MGEEITGRFKDHEGVELFRRCRVEANDRGALVVCHGLGEHSGRYTGVFEAARKAGLSYFALDHRGFGQSAGKRGVIDRFDQFLLGVRSLVEFAREKIGAGKRFFSLAIRWAV
ncbi:MAG: lysophospholipase [Deltaproteobacteria bacterium]|nr:lysophospholipase [Deltaproteobacteria bacterium]